MNRNVLLMPLACLSLALFSPDPAAAEGGKPSAPPNLSKVKSAKVTLPASLLDYRGHCPVTIKLGGSIITTGAGQVRYQFVHGSTPGPVQVLEVSHEGDYEVSETRTMDAQAPAWNDHVVLRILSNPGGPFDSSEVKYAGACQRFEPVAPTASLTLGPASGRFRVTINGFTCLSPTLDLTAYGDGADDEIFVMSKYFQIAMRPDGGTNVSEPGFARSMDIGDTSGGRFGQRDRGGSSRMGGANGGFRAGDSFPESPMKHSTNVQSQHLPMRAWEGTLERYKKAVVILPTIWESDMNTGLLYGPWQQQGLDSSLSAVGGLILNPMQTDQGVAKRSIQSEVLGQVSTGISIVAHVGDRPVGMQEYGGSHRFSPHVVVLTYDEAIRMIQLSAAKNGEAFPYTYTSAPALGGSYTLYLQVEQLPN